jgi:hypothetical protein
LEQQAQTRQLFKEGTKVRVKTSNVIGVITCTYGSRCDIVYTNDFGEVMQFDGIPFSSLEVISDEEAEKYKEKQME